MRTTRRHLTIWIALNSLTLTIICWPSLATDFNNSELNNSELNNSELNNSELTADFDADGLADVLSIELGSSVLTLRTGDGESGGYRLPRQRLLPSPITAFAVGEVNRRDGLPDLVVALEGAGTAPTLWVLESPSGAFDAVPERFELTGPASELRIERVDDDAMSDVVVFVEGDGLVVRGRDRRLSWHHPRHPAPAAVVERLDDAAGERWLQGELSIPGARWSTSQPETVGGLTLIVTSTGDEGDVLIGNGICETASSTCTLRAALDESNFSVGMDTIMFADLTGPIALGSPLSVTGPLLIDGTSHPDFVGDPLIELDGSAAGTALVLAPGSDGSVIRSLVIHSASTAGIAISGSGANTIDGCYVGVGADGATPKANGDGIKLTGSAVANVITGNVISGNTSDGIELEISSTITATMITGNLIGSDKTGLIAAGNGDHGIVLGGPSNTVGGTTEAMANLIAFNGMNGVLILRDDNLLQGNWIGLALDGSAAGNGSAGVEFGPPAGNATVGGTVAGAGNVISANAGDGIRLRIGVDVLIQGNLIGTDPSGLLDRGNSGFGICDGCPGGFRNTVGGTVLGAGNVISANALGAYATGSFDSVVQGNIIGLDADGEGVLGNGDVGISGSDTVVGGSSPLAGNLVSANAGPGVRVGTDAIVLGNRIGLTDSGAPAGNSGAGLHVPGTRVQVGGVDPGEANIIAYNTGDGVAITDSGSLNTVSANSIFGNAGLGIDIDDDGITDNDAGDGDFGTNDLQNFPILSSADAFEGTVSGELDGADGVLHTIEVFASESCDPSGNGEGGTYLGSGSVATDGAGGVGFTIEVTGFSVGDAISATATNAAGSTSEFSPCLEAGGDAMPIFSDDFESGSTTAWSLAVP